MSKYEILQDTKKRRKLVDVVFLRILSERKKMRDESYDPHLFDDKVVKYYYIIPVDIKKTHFVIKFNKRYIEEYSKLQELRRVELEGEFDLSGLVEGGTTKEVTSKVVSEGGKQGTGKKEVKKREEPELPPELLKKLEENVGSEEVESLLKEFKKTFGSISKSSKELERSIEKVINEKEVESYLETLKEQPITYPIYEFKNTLTKVFKEERETVRVFVTFDQENNEIRYIIEDQCTLSKMERDIFERLLNAIEETPGYITTIDELTKSEYSNKQELIEMYVIKWVDELWNLMDIKVTSKMSRFKIIVNLLRELVGYKHLNPLFYDKEYIEDISYVAVRSPVRVRYRLYSEWLPVYMRDKNKKLHPVTFNTMVEANEFVRLLAQKAGQYVNVAMPIVDGRLPDNSRLHAKYSTTITSPEKGPTFTIRLKRERVILPLDLINWRTVSPAMMAYAWMTVEVIPTASIVIAGTTGAGKTTTLQSILMFIPPTAKILSIEDTPELKLPHPHWEATYTLESTYSQKKITMFDLVKGALRERPDYIVVQEVRGAEAMDMFHAMASGHAALTTFHAGSFDEVINRFINEPINVPIHFLASTLKQIWIQLIVPSDDPNTKLARKVVEVWEVGGYDPKEDTIKGYKLFKYDFLSRRFDATDELIMRLFEPDSIFFQLRLQMGFRDSKELFREWQMRVYFLDALSKIYKVYTLRNVLKNKAMTQEQRRVYDEIIQFWDGYMKKHNGDLSMVFFDILFEYRVKKEEILSRVRTLYEMYTQSLEEIVGS